MDDWTDVGLVASLGVDVAPTAGYRGALAWPVNRVADKSGCEAPGSQAMQ